MAKLSGEIKLVFNNSLIRPERTYCPTKIKPQHKNTLSKIFWQNFWRCFWASSTHTHTHKVYHKILWLLFGVFISRSLRVEERGEAQVDEEEGEAAAEATSERIHTENRQLQRRQLDKPNVSKFSVAYRRSFKCCSLYTYRGYVEAWEKVATRK